MKYGEDVDEIPDEMFGLTDQNAQLSERATIIKKDD
jgi:methyl-coenzyme M reductase subunit D